MQQRTALEQDVIDLARESYEILEKQLELQTKLMEMFKALTENILTEHQFPELILTEIGVNSKSVTSGRTIHKNTTTTGSFSP
ncbi:hypothetical protein [Pseudomonas sp. LD120]|uniref:hypothetical protein n=1 Tax=Pseudomonas sp. LD120 TaxID=485751 RepID=UPI00135806F4|nr:hypothetical protein [Pseudomonas sp. LD120]KAF0862823.1 hypothetical protein PLD_19295 [Pseudomonas sp. LD120]